MTEYSTSPAAIEVFRHSKERTAYWVRSHSPFHNHFRSPDSPPSVREELVSRESDEESSHSLPPKMVLRYGDGRADIPISHWHYEHPHDSHKPPPPPHGSHSRPRPHTTYHTHDHFSTPPEEIHILPSDPNAQPHRSTGTYRPRRSSEPFRHQTPQSPPHEDEEELFEPPAPRNNLNVPQPVVYSHSQHIHDPYDHHHPSHSHSRGNRPPPSIVYAPAHHHTSDHYAPPTIVYAPHKAPGMTHTISAPTGSGFPQYPRITATPYPSVHSNLESVYEEPRYGPRGPRPRDDVIPRSPSPISEADSGSTYYIIPTPGQKVKVLVSPQRTSVYTATSTTKSAASPHSPHSGTSGGGGGFKKPLFRRLISFASDLSRSSKGSSRKKLQRRHSLDAASARASSKER
ncbi:hypothetical protein PAXRUDRAFT_136209 [Paxillus rubicundulus Ve08.2h10]|uniref:Uncharacterized protein n=1 Tax=Paxillus rubicundulus Ve08.2h10 TaxID=930991 RepID=A0A0D0EBE6_9AGAM|nr:hypothetical protein PAXRUDRAFT_136209 [Paxillus rubicundulus Ve08.2h10]